MLAVSAVLVCLAASLLLVQFLGMQWKRRQLPPGPAPFPLFGNLLQMKFQIHHDILKKVRIFRQLTDRFIGWLKNGDVFLLAWFSFECWGEIYSQLYKCENQWGSVQCRIIES